MVILDYPYAHKQHSSFKQNTVRPRFGIMDISMAERFKEKKKRDMYATGPNGSDKNSSGPEIKEWQKLLGVGLISTVAAFAAAWHWSATHHKPIIEKAVMSDLEQNPAKLQALVEANTPPDKTVEAIVNQQQLVEVLLGEAGKLESVSLEGNLWTLKMDSGKQYTFMPDLSEKMTAMVDWVKEDPKSAEALLKGLGEVELAPGQSIQAEALLNHLKENKVDLTLYPDSSASQSGLEETSSFLGGGGGGGMDWVSIAMLALFGVIAFTAFANYRNQKKMMGGGLTGSHQSKPVMVENPGITFNDVAGMEEVIREMDDVLTMFKSIKSAYENAGKDDDQAAQVEEMLNGARLPRGILLHGPAGTGKTLLAKAFAGEADVPVIYANGADFVKLLVGSGASNLDNFFKLIREKAQEGPVVVIIDEFDALAPSREGPNTNEERKVTVNKFLSEMDGVFGLQNVVVFATTNHLSGLDPAAIRDGRFDRKYPIQEPVSPQERQAILDVHLNKLGRRIDSELDSLAVAKMLPPKTVGATIESVVNDAAIASYLRSIKDPDAGPAVLKMEDFKKVISKRFYGLEKVSDPRFTEEDGRRLAAHEMVGHALMGWIQDIRPNYISVVPRHVDGLTALGVVGTDIETMPQYFKTRSFQERQIRNIMAGRSIEERLFECEGEVSGGAANDWDKVDQMMRHMVTEQALYRRDVGDLKLSPWRSANGMASPASQRRVDAVDKFVNAKLNFFYEQVQAFHKAIPDVVIDELITTVQKARSLEGKAEIDAAFSSATIADNLTQCLTDTYQVDSTELETLDGKGLWKRLWQEAACSDEVLAHDPSRKSESIDIKV